MAMGISYSTAKWLAPASFLFDFACQQYGLLSTPSMKQVHDANLSFWSPNPFFIGAFFTPQQVLQVIWLYRLWKLDPKKGSTEKKELDTIVDYVPYYALGNACIGMWMFFWNSENLKTSNVFVTINTLSQLFYVMTRLEPLNTKSTSSLLTHLVAKTFAGIGVLDLLHNFSVAYYVDQPASNLIKALTGVGFAIGASFSDWIMGGCLVYDLIGLSVGQSAVGQSGNWGKILAGYALGAAAIVAVKNYSKPPYVSEPVDYDAAPEEDDPLNQV